MEKPNKIFVSKDLFRWSFDKPSEETDIEYVRKDAFVGKMNELYNEVYGSSLPESQGTRWVLKILKQFIV